MAAKDLVGVVGVEGDVVGAAAVLGLAEDLAQHHPRHAAARHQIAVPAHRQTDRHNDRHDARSVRARGEAPLRINNQCKTEESSPLKTPNPNHDITVKH